MSNKVIQQTENAVSKMVGYKIKLTRHFLERLGQRFGGKINANIVFAIRDAIRILESGADVDYDNVVGTAKYGGALARVAVTVSDETVVIKTVF